MRKFMFLVVFLTASQGFAQTKRETFKASCEGSFAYLGSTVSSASPATLSKSASDMCSIALERWDTDGWDKIQYPMYNGCTNAVELLFSPTAKNRAVRIAGMVDSHCGKIGKR